MADLARILTLPDLTVEQLFYELLAQDVIDLRARADERRTAAAWPEGTPEFDLD